MRKILPLSVLLLVALTSASCRKEAEKKAPDAKTSTKGTVSSSATSAPGTAPAAPTTTGIELGQAMPAYAATNVDGSKFVLAQRRDKVVLLNLWATWCGPCRYEIPELQRIHDKYAARGFEVVGVSVDEGSVDSVKEFIAERKMTYPQVLDPQGELANVLQTSVLPTSVMLDRSGRIIWKKVGAIEPNDTELEAAIQKSL